MLYFGNFPCEIVGRNQYYSDMVTIRYLLECHGRMITEEETIPEGLLNDHKNERVLMIRGLRR